MWTAILAALVLGCWSYLLYVVSERSRTSVTFRPSSRATAHSRAGEDAGAPPRAESSPRVISFQQPAKKGGPWQQQRRQFPKGAA